MRWRGVAQPVTWRWVLVSRTCWTGNAALWSTVLCATHWPRVAIFACCLLACLLACLCSYQHSQLPAGRSVDVKQGIWYAAGYNFTATDDNLVGYDLETGDVVSNVKLPFAAAPIVGLGQTIDVDTDTGMVIMTGAAGAAGVPGAALCGVRGVGGMHVSCVPRAGI